MRWLITGGCGFVGSNLAETLLSQGNDVVVLDNQSRVGSRDNLAWLRARHGAGWQFVGGDTRDEQAVIRLVQSVKPDVVAHLAGQVAMTTSLENPRLDFQVNALGTLNMLEALRLYSPHTALLYSSTNKVYGSLGNLRYQETDTRYCLMDYPDGLDETLPLDGHSPYGCSKLAADQYVRDYYRMYNIPTVVFRHSSMYGGRQFATYDQGWIGWFCLKALEMSDRNAPKFTISGDGKQVRDVLYSDDLVRAYIMAVGEISRTAGQIYNIGGGMSNSLSLLELFARLENLTGNRMRYRRIERRSGDQKVFVANPAKATADFGWSPQVSTLEGLNRMMEWVKSGESSHSRI